MTIKRPTASGWRDGSLFVTGLALIIYEAVLRTGPERPTLLILYAGMTGLPVFLRGDERRNGGPAPEQPQQPQSQGAEP